jgi:aldehyde:ferredoxin oxidoreductase
VTELGAFDDLRTVPGPHLGHSGRILTVDVTSGDVSVECPSHDQWRRYVGSGLMGTHYLLEHTPAGLDAFDPEALVVSGASSTPKYLLLEGGQLTLLDAHDLWGRDTRHVTEILKRRHGQHASVATIGVAGERLVRYASLLTDGVFAAARMGLGAVMGAKRIKALVVIGDAAPPVHDVDALQKLTRRYAEAIAVNILTRSQHDAPGFAAWFLDGDVTGYAGSANFATSVLPDWGSAQADLLDMVGEGHGLCPGCPSDCMKTFGRLAEAPPVILDEEAAAAFALYLGITSASVMVALARACQEVGLDPVSTAATLAWLREAATHGAIPQERWDLVSWQDPAALVALVHRVAERTADVHWLGEGVRRAAQAAGGDSEVFAMHVKGLELSPLEPRASAGQALAYAIAPLGPRYEIVEHDIDFDPVDGYPHGLDQMRTLGTTSWEPMAQLDERRVARTAVLVDMWSGLDALGICLFAGPPMRALTLRDVAALVSAVTGWETSEPEIFLWGRRRWNLMRLYNLREGIDAVADALPRRFFQEPIDAGRHAGLQLDEQTFRAAINQYYELVGWDSAGVPLPSTLVALGLQWATSGPDHENTP